MITCKEDLHNTQILGDGALEYQRLAFEFGIGWNELGTDLRLRSNYIGVTCKKYGHRYELASIRELSDDKDIKTLTINDLMMEQVKPIPQTKEVEWVNGDACIYDGSEYTFVGMTPTFNDLSCIVFDVKNGIEHVCVRKLSKPETEAERKEREELEAAYDLRCTFNKGNFISFDEFKNHHPTTRENWLRIRRKTNYKVKGE